MVGSIASTTTYVVASPVEWNTQSLQNIKDASDQNTVKFKKFQDWARRVRGSCSARAWFKKIGTILDQGWKGRGDAGGGIPMAEHGEEDGFAVESN